MEVERIQWVAMTRPKAGRTTAGMSEREWVDNARNGFQAGTSDLSSVFEAERRLRAVQLDLLKLKVELQTKYAEMERLAGGSL